MRGCGCFFRPLEHTLRALLIYGKVGLLLIGNEVHLPGIQGESTRILAPASFVCEFSRWCLSSWRRLFNLLSLHIHALSLHIARQFQKGEHHLLPKEKLNKKDGLSRQASICAEDYSGSRTWIVFTFCIQRYPRILKGGGRRRQYHLSTIGISLVAGAQLNRAHWKMKAAVVRLSLRIEQFKHLSLSLSCKEKYPIELHSVSRQKQLIAAPGIEGT